ncbi:hypothetical protein WJX72_004218 [[Myrmecia] bisecta]|uniref:Uncharacterized protein n=1 Tax=[Myrmecia] bisecta TaxID=41462 RepID=A0AAW1PL56_9CHLO
MPGRNQGGSSGSRDSLRRQLHQLQEPAAVQKVATETFRTGFARLWKPVLSLECRYGAASSKAQRSRARVSQLTEALQQHQRQLAAAKKAAQQCQQALAADADCHKASWAAFTALQHKSVDCEDEEQLLKYDRELQLLNRQTVAYLKLKQRRAAELRNARQHCEAMALGLQEGQDKLQVAKAGMEQVITSTKQSQQWVLEEQRAVQHALLEYVRMHQVYF